MAGKPSQSGMVLGRTEGTWGRKRNPELVFNEFLLSHQAQTLTSLDMWYTTVLCSMAIIPQVLRYGNSQPLNDPMKQLPVSSILQRRKGTSSVKQRQERARAMTLGQPSVPTSKITAKKGLSSTQTLTFIYLLFSIYQKITWPQYYTGGKTETLYTFL